MTLRSLAGSIGLACAGLLPIAAYALPMGYLHGNGPKAFPVVTLTWALLDLSITVSVIIGLLVLAGAWRRRADVAASAIATMPVTPGGNGLPWITIGVGITAVLLLGILGWTVTVLAAINSPRTAPALTIEVTGSQWWWKARYLNTDPSRIFTTANEIHIPTGQPVRVRLIGADVIHAFWVPALTGKMQTIPGQINETWIEAREPGRYRGQCTEYCGLQHAHMAVYVVADPPDVFHRWMDGQLQPAPAPATPEIARGEQVFVYRCGVCHTVRGTAAGGTVAPDLSHLMTRQTLAAATIPNTIGNLSGWIADPQHIKPGTLMPNLDLSGPELRDIRAFLETLK
jgi:cytochrome c oxidase subunit 2